MKAYTIKGASDERQKIKQKQENTSFLNSVSNDLIVFEGCLHTYFVFKIQEIRK